MMCNQLNIRTMKGKVVRTAWALLLLCPSFITAGISLTPCGSDGVQELLADQETHFICTAEGPVEWRLQLNKTTSAYFLAVCDPQCVQVDTVNGLFIIRRIDAQRSAMIVKPVSNPLLYNKIQYLSGRLGCSLRDVDNITAWCGLNYVAPPKNVSCTATNVSWSVNVSCTVASVFSSRKSYRCQLILLHDLSKNKTIANMTMETSSINEHITKSEVKVSGFCLFNTTLPSEEGLYGFSVFVSPGGQHFSASDKRFAVERPTPPTIWCSPHPYVLENTKVTCTCRTSSLGQPTGYMRWITGNLTNQERYVTGQQSVTQQELNYTQSLTLSDHSSTWFRCDIVWGTTTIQGENYTANVGYAAQVPRFSANGLEGNKTVMEGDQVHVRCESEGRPTPTVFIYNNDNDTVIRNNSSPVIYTFIARCEDTATYTCSAWNKFSNESDLANSYNLSLHIGCKPRSYSATDIGKITFRNKTEELMFDIISYPVPHKYEIWFVGPVLNSSISSSEKYAESAMNVICNASTDRKYMAKCKLTVFNAPSESGFYKVLVINEHGNETFTVEIIHSTTDMTLETTTTQPAQRIIAISLGVCAVLVFIATVIAFTILRLGKKKSKDSSTFRPTSSTSSRQLYRSNRDSEGDQSIQAPEVAYEIPWDSIPLTMQPSRVNVTAVTSHPVRCQTPVYAVVDKTRKKTNTRTHFAEAADDRGETRRNMAQGSKASHLRFYQDKDTDTDADYVVLDKSRGRATARQDKHYNNKNKPSPNRSKGYMDEEAENNDYDHLVMQQLPARQDVAAKREASACASNPHSEDDGKWVNDDGLIYVTPFFEVAAGVKRRPPPSQEETEYSTIQTHSLKKN